MCPLICIKLKDRTQRINTQLLPVAFADKLTQIVEIPLTLLGALSETSVVPDNFFCNNGLVAVYLSQKGLVVEHSAVKLCRPAEEAILKLGIFH